VFEIIYFKQLIQHNGIITVKGILLSSILVLTPKGIFF